MLHKVGKQWRVVSIALLMAIGSGAIATRVNASADTGNNHGNPVIESNAVNIGSGSYLATQKSVKNSDKAAHEANDMISSRQINSPSDTHSDSSRNLDRSTQNISLKGPSFPYHLLPAMDKIRYSHHLNEYYMPTTLYTFDRRSVPYMLTWGKPNDTLIMPNGMDVKLIKDRHSKLHVQTDNGKVFTNPDDFYSYANSTPIPQSFYDNKNNFIDYKVDPDLHFRYRNGNNISIYGADANGILHTESVPNFSGFKGEIVNLPLSDFDGMKSKSYPNFRPDWESPDDTIPIVLGDGLSKSYSVQKDGTKVGTDVDDSFWPHGKTVDMVTDNCSAKINYYLESNHQTVYSPIQDGIENTPVDIRGNLKNGTAKFSDGHGHQYSVKDWFNVDYKNSTDTKYPYGQSSTTVPLPDNPALEDNTPQTFNIALTPKGKWFHIPVALINDDQWHGWQVYRKPNGQLSWQKAEPHNLASNSSATDYPKKEYGYVNVYGTLGSTQTYSIFRYFVNFDHNNVNDGPNNIRAYNGENDSKATSVPISTQDPLNDRILLSRGNFPIRLGTDGKGNYGPDLYCWDTDSNDLNNQNPKPINAKVDKLGFLQLHYTDTLHHNYVFWPDMRYDHRFWTINNRNSNGISTYENNFVNSDNNRIPKNFNNVYDDTHDNEYNNAQIKNNAVNYFTDKDWHTNVAGPSPANTIYRMDIDSPDSGFKSDKLGRFIRLNADGTISKVQSVGPDQPDQFEADVNGSDVPVTYNGMVGQDVTGKIESKTISNYNNPVDVGKLTLKSYKHSPNDYNDYAISKGGSANVTGELVGPKGHQVWLPMGVSLLTDIHGNPYQYDLKNNCYDQYNSVNATDPDYGGNNKPVMNPDINYNYKNYKDNNNSYYYLGSENEYAQPQNYKVNFMDTGNYIYTGYFNDNNKYKVNDLTHGINNDIDEVDNAYKLSGYSDNHVPPIKGSTEVNGFTGDSLNFDPASGHLTLGYLSNPYYDWGTHSQQDMVSHTLSNINMPNGRVFDPDFQSQYYNDNIHKSSAENQPIDDKTWILGNSDEMQPLGGSSGNDDHNIDIFTADKQAVIYSDVKFINAFNGQLIADGDQANGGNPRTIVMSPDQYNHWHFTYDNIDQYLSWLKSKEGFNNIQVKQRPDPDGKVVHYIDATFPNSRQYQYITAVNPPFNHSGGITYIFLANFDPNNPSSDGNLGNIKINYVTQDGKLIDNNAHNFQEYGLYHLGQDNGYSYGTIDQAMGQNVKLYPTSDFGKYSTDPSKWDKNETWDQNEQYDDPKDNRNGSDPHPRYGQEFTYQNGPNADKQMWDYNQAGYHELGVLIGNYQTNNTNGDPYGDTSILNDDKNSPIFNKDGLFGTQPVVTIILAKNPAVRLYYVDYAGQPSNSPKYIPLIKDKSGNALDVAIPGKLNATVPLDSSSDFYKNVLSQHVDNLSTKYQYLYNVTDSTDSNKKIASSTQSLNTNAPTNQSYPIYVTAPDIRVHYQWFYNKGHDITLKNNSSYVDLKNPMPGTPFNIGNYDHDDKLNNYLNNTTNVHVTGVSDNVPSVYPTASDGSKDVYVYLGQAASQGSQSAQATDNIHYYAQSATTSNSQFSSSSDTITYYRSVYSDPNNSDSIAYGPWSTASSFSAINSVSSENLSGSAYHLSSADLTLPSVNSNEDSKGSGSLNPGSPLEFSNDLIYVPDSTFSAFQPAAVQEDYKYIAISNGGSSVMSSYATSADYTRPASYDANNPSSSSVGTWSLSGNSLGSPSAFSLSGWNILSSSDNIPVSISSNDLSVGQTNTYYDDIYYVSSGDNDQYTTVKKTIDYVLKVGDVSASVASNVQNVIYHRASSGQSWSSAAPGFLLPASYSSAGWQAFSSDTSDYANVDLSELSPGSTSSASYDVEYQTTSEKSARVIEQANYYYGGVLKSSTPVNVINYYQTYYLTPKMINIVAGAWSESGELSSAAVTSSSGWHFDHSEGSLPASVAPGTNGSYVENLYYVSNGNSVDPLPSFPPIVPPSSSSSSNSSSSSSSASNVVSSSSSSSASSKGKRRRRRIRSAVKSRSQVRSWSSAVSHHRRGDNVSRSLSRRYNDEDRDNHSHNYRFNLHRTGIRRRASGTKTDRQLPQTSEDPSNVSKLGIILMSLGLLLKKWIPFKRRHRN